MIVIRDMELRDVEPVSKLEEEAFSMPWSPKDFIQMIHNDNAIYVVADEDGMIVGACGVRNIAGDGEITNVVVKAEQRRKGIAHLMLTELLYRGDKMGIQAFTLEVRKSNVSAITLYENFGFLNEGIRKEFYDFPKEDAYIMWKR